MIFTIAACHLCKIETPLKICPVILVWTYCILADLFLGDDPFWWQVVAVYLKDMELGIIEHYVAAKDLMKWLGDASMIRGGK